MSLAETRRDQLFPALCAVQIAVAQRFATAPPQKFEPGETLYALGERHAPVFIVTNGEVLVNRGHSSGEDQLIATLPIGGITGEYADELPALVNPKFRICAGACTSVMCMSDIEKKRKSLAVFATEAPVTA